MSRATLKLEIRLDGLKTSKLNDSDYRDLKRELTESISVQLRKYDYFTTFSFDRNVTEITETRIIK